MNLRVPILTLAVVALSSCGTTMFQNSREGLPAFYQPGGQEQDEPSIDAAFRSPESAALAPQEKAEAYSENWAQSSNPAAGPAPRNTVSGGVMDIGIVQPAPEGTAVIGAPSHRVEPTESGRLYILELYQDVLDQRDALDLEVTTLIAELEAAHATIAGLRGKTGEERGRVVVLEQELAQARAENEDLTARLTTAQIRRLESEKLLLETRIEMHQAMFSASPAELKTPVSPGTGLALKKE